MCNRQPGNCKRCEHNSITKHITPPGKRQICSLGQPRLDAAWFSALLEGRLPWIQPKCSCSHQNRSKHVLPELVHRCTTIFVPTQLRYEQSDAPAEHEDTCAPPTSPTVSTAYRNRLQHWLKSSRIMTCWLCNKNCFRLTMPNIPSAGFLPNIPSAGFLLCG